MFDFQFDEDEAIRIIGLEHSSPDVQAEVIAGIHVQLENLLRARLTSEMTLEDHEAFDKAIEASDEAAVAWLEARFPNYTELYQEELDGLLMELRLRGDAAARAGKRLAEGQ